MMEVILLQPVIGLQLKLSTIRNPLVTGNLALKLVDISVIGVQHSASIHIVVGRAAVAGGVNDKRITDEQIRAIWIILGVCFGWKLI
jgi:hypothetical protein